MDRTQLALLLATMLAACAGSAGSAGGASATPALAPAQGRRPGHGAPAPAAGDARLDGDGSIQWIGGPTVALARGGLRVLTDPMLRPRGDHAFVLPRHPSTGAPDAPIARYLAPAPLAIDEVDAIIISHTHADHVDARAREILPKDRPVIVAAAGAEAMRAAGFRQVRALDWGESTTVSAHGTTLCVLAVPAHHSHDARLDHDLGRGNGYVLEWQDARGSYRVYWTGDAVLSDETRDFAARHGRVDLLLPHLGGVGGVGERGLRTMNAEEALELVRRVDPRLVVPIHHTTFGHYREPIEALEQRAQESGEAGRFRFPRLGQPIALPAR